MTAEYTIRPASSEDYWYCYRLTKKNMLHLFTRHWGGWVPAKFREGFDVDAISIIVVAGRRAGYLSAKRTVSTLTTSSCRDRGTVAE